MHWANGKIELGIWNIKKYIIFFKNVFGHIKRIAVTAIHQKFHLQSEIGCMSDSESHVKGQWRPDIDISIHIWSWRTWKNFNNNSHKIILIIDSK